MLVSVALSGIKRSTGLTPAVSRMPNKDLRNLMRIYLEAGEWVGNIAIWLALAASIYVVDVSILTYASSFTVDALQQQIMDFSVVILGRSSSFERVR